MSAVFWKLCRFFEELMQIKMERSGDSTLSVVRSTSPNIDPKLSHSRYSCALELFGQGRFVAMSRDMTQTVSQFDQKGIEYLWSVGTPEAVEVLQELYDHKGPDDYKARMHLCEALIHFKDPRGLPEDLAVMADSFGNAPESSDENVLKANLKLNEDKRSQALEVLERANDEMFFAAVLEQIHSENIGMRRAILHALKNKEAAGTTVARLESPLTMRVKKSSSGEKPTSHFEFALPEIDNALGGRLRARRRIYPLSVTVR